jgi:hypothetical protein
MDQSSLLNNDEVLYVRSGSVLMSNGTFKAREFLDALAQLVSEREDEWSDDQEGWFNERGLNCEALRFGNQGWQRGRVRIRMEFIPDDSPKLLREAPPVQRERAPYEMIFLSPEIAIRSVIQAGITRPIALVAAVVAITLRSILIWMITNGGLDIAPRAAAWNFTIASAFA